jgi:hypothetical protein
MMPTINRRLLPHSFHHPAVPSGETVLIEDRMMLTFRGKLIIVDSETAPHFDLLDLRVGQVLQKADTAPLSMACLLTMKKIYFEKLDESRMNALLMSFGLDMDTAQVGQRICMAVKNKSAETRPFYAAIYGVEAVP